MFSRKALKPHLSEIIDHKNKSSQGIPTPQIPPDSSILPLLEERMALVKDLQERYPGRIPVIFLKARKSNAKQIEINRYILSS